MVTFWVLFVLRVARMCEFLGDLEGFFKLYSVLRRGLLYPFNYKVIWGNFVIFDSGIMDCLCDVRDKDLSVAIQE